MHRQLPAASWLCVVCLPECSLLKPWRSPQHIVSEDVCVI